MKIKSKISVFIFIVLIFNLTIKNLYAEIPLYKLNAIKISYKDNNKIIIAEGEANAKDQYGTEIYSDYIIYDKINNIIKTRSNSKYLDRKGNIIHAENFLYDLNLKKIKALNKVKYEEQKGNIFHFDEFEYFEKSSKGLGKNVKGFLTDKSSFESSYVEIDNNLNTITIKTNEDKVNFINKIKSLFKKENKYTTCENFDGKTNIKDQCPDWSLSTYETKQDSKKKMLYHKHAIIKLKNIPVFYTPYFSHPDPTVKRKTGFLTPSTKNFNNLGRTLKAPYFWEINEDKDLTFTPIFYQKEKNIYLIEYRQQNINNNLYIDSSYSKGFDDLNKKGKGGENLNRTGGSRNHFFMNFNGSYNNIFFDRNDVEINLQRISQKNYLKLNQINTQFIKEDISSLQNNIILNSYKDNKKIKIATYVYENLNDDNENTKYQYIFPSIEYEDFFMKYNQNFNLIGSIDLKNYNGNSKQGVQINKINSNSNPLIFKNLGISNILKTSLSNINLYNEEVSNEKENLNSEFFSAIAIESSFPLIKLGENKEETLTPKVFTKFSPGSMKDASSETKILSYSDTYSMDRNGSSRNPERGLSLGYGIDYNINSFNENNEIFFRSNLGIGQVLNDTKNSKISRSSSLNKRSSNFIGEFNFFFNKSLKENKKVNIKKNLSKNINDTEEGFNLKYNFNLSNDLEKILKSDLELKFSNEFNYLKSNYYELHDIGSQQYLKLEYGKNFNNNFNFLLGGTRNLERSFSENNYLEANYESDCLKIGINLAKKFYENSEIKADNNLTLFIMLKPFGQPIAPDLTSFIEKKQ